MKEMTAVGQQPEQIRVVVIGEAYGATGARGRREMISTVGSLIHVDLSLIVHDLREAVQNGVV